MAKNFDINWWLAKFEDGSVLKSKTSSKFLRNVRLESWNVPIGSACVWIEKPCSFIVTVLSKCRHFVDAESVIERGCGGVWGGVTWAPGGHVLRCDVTTPTSHRSNTNVCGLRTYRLDGLRSAAIWTSVVHWEIVFPCGNLTSVYKVSEQRLKLYDVTDVGLLDYLFVLRSHKVIRYDTKEEFNVDSKVEWSA